MNKLLPVLALVVLIGGFFAWRYYHENTGRLPEAASLLVNPVPGSGALPHSIESDTHFEEALVHLQEDAPAPGLVPRTPPDEPEAPALSPIQPNGVNVVPNLDWRGMVLVPDMAVMSRAHTTDVALERVEAHPLVDGRLRVWVRIRNQLNQPIQVETATAFRIAPRGEEIAPSFVPFLLPAQGNRVVVFTSLEPAVLSYTIMVKQSSTP